MNNRGRLIGSVDDVTIYSGVLTAEQVKTAYEEKSGTLDTEPAPFPSKADPAPAAEPTGFQPHIPSLT